MSDYKNTGAAAFPQPENYSAPGMTLRDYFAAKAMESIIGAVLMDGNRTEYSISNPRIHEFIAQDAYHLADAMLKARNE